MEIIQAALIITKNNLPAVINEVPVFQYIDILVNIDIELFDLLQKTHDISFKSFAGLINLREMLTPC